MMPSQTAFAAAAEDLVGTPFRLRGRDPATGIDCVGLVLCSLIAIGREPPRLPHYTLRNTEVAPLLDLLPDAGFRAVGSAMQSGDLLLLRPSPGQFHLAIVKHSNRLIQAHAGLGRVVISPVPDPMPTAGHWRLT